MPTVPALWNIMKFTHLLKVHQISSNMQNILGSASETWMWNLSSFREVKFFCEKMSTVKFNHLLKVHQISSNLQNILGSASEPACEIGAYSEKLKVFREKRLTMLVIWNIMKFPHLFKVYEISSNLQNILGSASEIIMWDLSSFIEKFVIKNADSTALSNIIKFTHLLKVHQIASNLQNILGSASETCMWNLRPFMEVKIISWKCDSAHLLKVHQNHKLSNKPYKLVFW